MNTDVAFIPKDMILPIALGIMSFFLNFIGYFLFYISKKKIYFNKTVYDDVAM